MFNSSFKLSRNIIIALVGALIIVIALVAVTRYLIVRDKRRAEPKPPQSTSTTVPDDVLRSLTPPEGAAPAAIDQKTLDSLTPPKDAKPAGIPQSALDSITPPAK